eukprot:CAMPEP_0182452170 /NCGR_PEP_ID=MMETSP1172-20130603/44108_1 /TAXON_ID=708627 /ORGANISM="Timspurckia oligopyrenoides, Strain CCMP3278" /LENGTH=667 /DNA_ID=CAMNT_0024649991 /DNA_START=77 /DNA_END=2080 /DNA_ORIENTATION=+
MESLRNRSDFDDHWKLVIDRFLDSVVECYNTDPLDINNDTAQLHTLRICIVGQAASGSSTLADDLFQYINHQCPLNSPSSHIKRSPSSQLRSQLSRLKPLSLLKSFIIHILTIPPYGIFISKDYHRSRTSFHPLRILKSEFLHEYKHRKSTKVAIEIIDVSGMNSDGHWPSMKALREYIGTQNNVSIPTLILYTARLNETRTDSSESLCLRAVTNVFGEFGWRRSVLVFTFGSTIPFEDIPWRVFVRGRRDFVRSFLRQILPPENCMGLSITERQNRLENAQQFLYKLNVHLKKQQLKQLDEIRSQEQAQVLGDSYSSRQVSVSEEAEGEISSENVLDEEQERFEESVEEEYDLRSMLLRTVTDRGSEVFRTSVLPTSRKLVPIFSPVWNRMIDVFNAVKHQMSRIKFIPVLHHEEEEVEDCDSEELSDDEDEEEWSGYGGERRCETWESGCVIVESSREGVNVEIDSDGWICLRDGSGSCCMKELVEQMEGALRKWPNEVWNAECIDYGEIEKESRKENKEWWKKLPWSSILLCIQIGLSVGLTLASSHIEQRNKEKGNRSENPQTLVMNAPGYRPEEHEGQGEEFEEKEDSEDDKEEEKRVRQEIREIISSTRAQLFEERASRDAGEVIEELDVFRGDDDESDEDDDDWDEDSDRLDLWDSTSEE